MRSDASSPTPRAHRPWPNALSGGEVLDAVPVCLALVGVDGVPTFANAAWTRRLATGCERGDPFGDARFVERVQATLRGDVDTVAFDHVCRQHGVDRCFHVTATRLGARAAPGTEAASGAASAADAELAPPSEVPSVVAVVTAEDVTQQRANERSLAAARRLDTLGPVVGSVAHDFNNLLTVIAGNAELLLDGVGEGSLRRAAELVRVSAERGTEQVQRLLAFGRRQVLRPRTVVVRELIDDLASLVRAVLGARGRLVVHVDDDVPVRFDVDVVRFEAAILELAVNALDASPGVVTLRLEVARSTGDPSALLGDATYLRVRVRDEGLGVAPALVDRVFEPYVTDKPGHVGLGLAMVHGFVSQSGGAVALGSRLGHGTTIDLWFPAAGDGVADGALAAGGDAVAATPRVAVVADDDPLLRRALAATVAALGYVPIEACDARAALEALVARGGADLLVTDVTMPGGPDGHVLAAEARRRWPGLAIVVVSGDERAEARAVEAGHAFVAKPFLGTRLDDALERAAAHRAGPGAGR